MKNGREREEKNKKSVTSRRRIEHLWVEESVFKREGASAGNHGDDSLGHARHSVELVCLFTPHAPFEIRYRSHSSGTRSNFASGIWMIASI
jgi:hypothetical protein